jgi:AraC-like DNA-binding protein
MIGPVLVAGDASQTCTLIAAWLTDLGCDVESVPAGGSRPLVIHEGAFRFVVVADITSGVIGVEIVKVIRRADATVPIMLITSGNCEIGFWAGRAGADIVLTTPIDRPRFEAPTTELILNAKTKIRHVTLFRAPDRHLSPAVVAVLTAARELETSSLSVLERRLSLATQLGLALLGELTIFEFEAIASGLRLVNRESMTGAEVFDQIKTRLERAIDLQTRVTDRVIFEIATRLEEAGTNWRHVSEADMSVALGASRRVVGKALARVGLDFVRIRKAVAMRRAVLQSHEDFPVKFVAFDLGYEDESHFMHDFSRFFGISLRKFRRLLKN